MSAVHDTAISDGVASQGSPGGRSDGERGPGELLSLDVLRGLDSAVIKGFLELDEARRSTLLAAYTARYGDAAGAWLRRAVLLWERTPRGTGLGVSRVTLARLFALLPETMDQAERLRLAESIWHTAHAPTRAVLRIPPGYRNHAVLTALVHEHFQTVLPGITELPPALRGEVPWLSDPAMQAQHQVLNLLLLAERDQLLTLADQQIEVLFSHRLDGMEIRSQLKIAGHELWLRTDADALEPTLRLRQAQASPLRAQASTGGARSALMGAVIGAAIALACVLLFAVLG